MRNLFRIFKEFLTGVRIERQTEYWCYPEWGKPGYEIIEQKRNLYEKEMTAKGWEIGGIQCRCCNVGFYRYVKIRPWGRPTRRMDIENS